MTHRERVLKTLNHKEQGVPIDFGGWLSGIKPGAYKKLCKHLGLRLDTWDTYSPSEEILKRWDIDFRRVTPSSPEKAVKINPDGSKTDEWGIVRVAEAGDEQITHFPLKDASIEDIDKLKHPDPFAPGRYDKVQAAAKKWRDLGYFVVAQPDQQGVFEMACWLCGFERLMTDMVTDENFVQAVFEKIARLQETFAENYYSRLGDMIDMVQLGDDFGTQNGPFISDDLYRRLIRPYQMRYHLAIRKNTNAFIFHHSCGSIFRLLDSMIRSGIEIVNPTQCSAAEMEPEKLKETFGSRVTFHGGVDVQTILPRKSPGEIREYVKHLLRTLAPGGGYILAPTHNIQDDTPPENICAMYDAALEFGKYPIRC